MVNFHMMVVKGISIHNFKDQPGAVATVSTPAGLEPAALGFRCGALPTELRRPVAEHDRTSMCLYDAE